MVLLGLLICLLCMVFNIYIYKDLTIPPLILSFIWVFIHFLVLFKSSLVDSYFFLAFSISLVLFSVGFYVVYIFTKNKRRISQNIESLTYDLKKKEIIALVLISTVFVFVSTVDILRFVQANYLNNFWQTINYGRGAGLYEEFFLFSYLRLFLIPLSLITIAITFKENKYKWTALYLFVLTLISLVMIGNRSVLFLYIIAVLFLLILVKQFTNRKKFIILLLLFIIILGVFSYFNILKFVKDKETNLLDFLLNYVEVYFSYSLISFTIWIENFSEYLYGTNTFKFFATILIALGFELYVEENIQEYVTIGDSKTNVYTILEYYVQDFGLIYALMIIALLGVVYGLLYKLMLNKKDNLIYIIILSLLYYPLIYQFFGDQYFSILSTWIQLIFWTIILVKFIVIKQEVNNEKRS